MAARRKDVRNGGCVLQGTVGPFITKANGFWSCNLIQLVLSMKEKIPPPT